MMSIRVKIPSGEGTDNEALSGVVRGVLVGLEEAEYLN